MLDDLDRLRNNPRLLQLCSHYADLGKDNQEAWQNRLMEMAEVSPRDIVKLHGELIAFGWIEQNTGQIPGCYRITSAGLRALRKVGEGDILTLPERPAWGKKGKKAA